MSMRPALALVLALTIASSAAAGIARIGGEEFESLDAAVGFFWKKCRDDPLHFEPCFGGPFLADYPDPMFRPCRRVPHFPFLELSRDTLKWLDGR
jgi:hypothetical protein